MATTLYVDGDVGNDDNSGSSEGASPVVSGTGAATNNTTTVNLSADSPDLSGVSAGDTIRLNGEAEGYQTSDVYRILTVDDGNDLLTVDPQPTTTQGSITWAIGGATKTIQRAVDTTEIGAASKIYIKNSVTYQETVTTVNVFGDAAGFAEIVGYSDIITDDGLVIIDGEGSRNCFVTGTSTNYLVIRNLRATDSSGLGFGPVGADWLAYNNCEADNNVSHGFGHDGITKFIDCHSYNNGGNGFLCGGDTFMINCVANDNTLDGYLVDGGTVDNCLSYGNIRHGIAKGGVSADLTIINCTVHGKGKTTDSGIYITTGNQRAVINCIIVECAVGITAIAGNEGQEFFSDSNCLFNNTDNYVGWTAKKGEITSDPLFIDPDNDDYTLQYLSPCASGGKSVANLRNFAGTMVGDRAVIGALPAGPKAVILATLVATASPGLHINGDLG